MALLLDSLVSVLVDESVIAGSLTPGGAVLVRSGDHSREAWESRMRDL
jgi:hypothetical protein